MEKNILKMHISNLRDEKNTYQNIKNMVRTAIGLQKKMQ